MFDAHVPMLGADPVFLHPEPVTEPQVLAVRLDPRDLLLIFAVMMAANLLSLCIVAAVMTVTRPR